MRNLLFILGLSVLLSGSCKKDKKDNSDEPHGSCPANYTGTWTLSKQSDTDKPLILLLGADGKGAVSSTQTSFRWKVDENNTLWRLLGNEWNGLWKSSSADATGLTFQEETKTIRLLKIASPNPSEYVGTWKVTRAVQSTGGDWENTNDVSKQYNGKTIILKQDGNAQTIPGVARKWIVDEGNRLIWMYQEDYTLWEAVSVLDIPRDGKMSLVVVQSPEFLNLDLEKQ